MQGIIVFSADRPDAGIADETENDGGYDHRRIGHEDNSGNAKENRGCKRHRSAVIEKGDDPEDGTERATEDMRGDNERSERTSEIRTKT